MSCCSQCGNPIESWVLDGWPDADECSYCSAGMDDEDGEAWDYEG